MMVNGFANLSSFSLEQLLLDSFFLFFLFIFFITVIFFFCIETTVVVRSSSLFFSKVQEHLLDFLFVVLPLFFVFLLLIPALGFLYCNALSDETLFEVFVCGKQWTWSFFYLDYISDFCVFPVEIEESFNKKISFLWEILLKKYNNVSDFFGIQIRVEIPENHRMFSRYKTFPDDLKLSDSISLSKQLFNPLSGLNNSVFFRFCDLEVRISPSSYLKNRFFCIGDEMKKLVRYFRFLRRLQKECWYWKEKNTHYVAISKFPFFWNNSKILQKYSELYNELKRGNYFSFSKKLFRLLNGLNNRFFLLKFCGLEKKNRFVFPSLLEDWSFPFNEEMEKIKRHMMINSLVFPVGFSIRLVITSTDVIHSFSVPSLGIKVDAIPGYFIMVFLYSDECNEYVGQCAELCGVHHSVMPLRLISVPFFEFFFFLYIMELN